MPAQELICWPRKGLELLFSTLRKAQQCFASSDVGCMWPCHNP